ncbi:RidA family protein [Rhodohalobacter halophilus]|uniref:RidA family protein n=1 Tax=Rhodohalobacter halophilus TaxID=1812810 RepID=UPI00083F66B0|nr:RidA family protein [Rhodohalobacter halophilus]
MNHKTVSTNKAPKALGPYTQATVHNGVVYCSGQIALDPITNEVVQGGVKEQTHQVLKNLSEVLKEAGSGLDKVLKCTIFLDDMREYPNVNEVYGTYFSDNLPAREAVAVEALPKYVKVEISCIAYI